MLQKSCARFQTHVRSLLRQSSSTINSSPKNTSENLQRNNKKDAKNKKTENLKVKDILAMVDYVDLTKMPIEKIVRSPIQLLHKNETLKINERNLKKAQRTQKNIHARIMDLTAHKWAFQFLSARRLNNELHENINSLMKKGILDREFGQLIQSMVKVNPKDLTNIKNYPVYPGSPKGPFPEDDPQFYQDWTMNNLPPVLKRLKAEIEMMFAEQSENMEEQDDGAQISEEKATEVSRITLGSAFSGNFSPADYVLSSMQQVEYSNTLHVNLSPPDDVPEEMKVDIPYFPKDLPLDKHYHLNAVLEWSLMRSFIIANKAFTGLNKRLKEMGEKKSTNRNNSDDCTDSKEENIFMTHYYPSVYGYYNLLPKQVREHPAVVTATVGLERYAHQMPIQKKLDFLNMAAKVAQPIPDRFLTRPLYSRRDRT